MNVVLLLFCVLAEIIILLLLSSVKIDIQKIEISNLQNNIKQKKLKKEFIIYFEIFLFGKIKILKIKLRKNLLNKIKIKSSKEEIQKDITFLKKVKIIDIIKKLHIKVDYFKLSMGIGTDNAMTTAIISGMISSIIAIGLKNSYYDDIKYHIEPLYQFGNAINFNLNCIINVKVVHIIYVIYILLKRGRKKNERTSNRRSYGYSYE